MACANSVSFAVDIGGPPSSWLGWEGVPLSGELGAQGWLHRPVQRRGLERRCTIRVRLSTIGNGRSKDAGPSPVVERSAPKYDVGREEEDKMVVGGGEVVVCGVRELCVMSSRGISARMASRGAARRLHST